MEIETTDGKYRFETGEAWDCGFEKQTGDNATPVLGIALRSSAVSHRFLGYVTADELAGLLSEAGKLPEDLGE